MKHQTPQSTKPQAGCEDPSGLRFLTVATLRLVAVWLASVGGVGLWVRQTEAQTDCEPQPLLPALSSGTNILGQFRRLRPGQQRVAPITSRRKPTRNAPSNRSHMSCLSYRRHEISRHSHILLTRC